MYAVKRAIGGFQILNDEKPEYKSRVYKGKNAKKKAQAQADFLNNQEMGRVRRKHNGREDHEHRCFRAACAANITGVKIMSIGVSESHPSYGFLEKHEFSKLCVLCPLKDKEEIKGIKRRAAGRKTAYNRKQREMEKKQCVN